MPSPVMTPETSTVVNARAALGVEAPNLTAGLQGLSAEQKAAIARADEQRQAGRIRQGVMFLAEGQEPGQTEQRVRHEGTYRSAVDRIVFTGEDQDGKKAKASNEEEAKADKIKKDLDLRYKYMRVGFGGLTNQEKIDLRKQITDAASVSRDKTLWRLITDDQGTVIIDVLDDILTANPDLLIAWENSFFAENNEDFTEIGKLDKEIAKLRKKLAEARRRKDLASAENTAVKKSQGNSNNFETKQERIKVGSKEETGTKREILERLEEELVHSNSRDQGIPGFRNNLREIDRLRRQLQIETDGQKKAAAEQDLNKLLSWVTKAENDKTYGSQCKVVHALHDEERNNLTNLDRSQRGEGAQINQGLETAEAELRQLTVELDALLHQRQIITDVLTGEIDNAFGDELVKRMYQRMKERLGLLPTEEGPAKTELQKRARAKLKQGLDARYTREATRWEKLTKRAATVIDEKRVRLDYILLTATEYRGEDGKKHPGGPRVLLQMHLHQAGFTPQEVGQLMQDEAFVGEQMKIIIPHLLTSYTISGGHPSQAELQALLISPTTRDAFPAWFEQSKACRDYYEQAKANGLTQEKSFGEFIHKLSPASLIMMILMFLGITEKKELF